eukprot:PITA_10979
MLDRKEKSIIRLCVSDLVLLNVSGEATTKALWDKLGTLYQYKSLVNKLFLQKKLYILRMKDGDSVIEHLNAFNTVFDEIVSTLLTEEMRRKNMDNHNGASFHFTPHREWFYEYEKYDGGDVFLRDDRKVRIIGRVKVRSKLQGGRVRTLPGVLHIPALARNLISVSELDDAGIKIVFEKDTCKMVRGALVLMPGVQIGTLYKLQGSTVVDGCNSFMVPENGEI